MYGQTETTAVVFHSMPNDDMYHSTETVGHLGEHVEVKVVDIEGRLVPFGQSGELWIRSYANMVGFWDDEEKTKKVIGTDGWLKTG